MAANTLATLAQYGCAAAIRHTGCVFLPLRSARSPARVCIMERLRGTSWTPGRACRHTPPMSDDPDAADTTLRAGEAAIVLPAGTDAGVYFIGTIHTPWTRRADCPKRGAPDGPICTIVVDPRWQVALTDIAGHGRLQVLYWMHQARRDLVLQTPHSTGRTTGCFALRSPVRPNPIASSVVVLVAIDGNVLQVRGLDCLDGTPLIDLKPDRPSGD
jgi:tRNA-Thr(GGU) m(6)t(6)A37 methyltransferase TsaA